MSLICLGSHSNNTFGQPNVFRFINSPPFTDYPPLETQTRTPFLVLLRYCHANFSFRIQTACLHLSLGFSARRTFILLHLHAAQLSSAIYNRYLHSSYFLVSSETAFFCPHGVTSLTFAGYVSATALTPFQESDVL